MAKIRRKRTGESAVVATASAPARADATGTVSRKPNWRFRLAALVLVPLVLLGTAELALRVFGYGYPVHFFLPYSAGDQPRLIENQQYGWRFFPPAAARTPRPMLLPAVKPAGTVRIFVLGESAAYGDPEPDFGLPRLLELLLRERFPRQRFEVINVAMTAINSHVILPIARDCARQSGDLWVVYMGNNEVVGPFGAGTVFGPQTPPLALARANVAFKATKIGQLLDDVRRQLMDRQSVRRAWGGMEMFVQNQLRQDDPRMGRVYVHFERNLRDIAQVGLDAGAQILLCTVASNLKDCAPFASLHRPDLGEARRVEWEGVYRAGAAAEQAGQYQPAMEAFERAARIDDRYAELQFRWGRCCQALGQLGEARRHFILARDYDALRFRADSRLNDLIRQTAKNLSGKRLALVDAEEVISRQSPQGIAGGEFFWEHVHFNFDGNYALARALAEQVTAQMGWETNSRPGAIWLSREACARKLALTVWNQCEATERVQQRLELAPFTYQLNHDAQYRQYQQQAEHWRSLLTPDQSARDVQWYRDALVESPDDWVFHENLAQLYQSNDQAGPSAVEWTRVTELLPHYADAQYQLAVALDQLGRKEEAQARFEQALRLRPIFPEALNGMGLILANQDKYSQAIEKYREALRWKPDFAGARVNYGVALSRLGKTEEAKAEYREALRLKPDNVGARINLGKLLNGEGKLDEAIVHYREAIKVKPDNPVAHYNLGHTLLTAGNLEEARAEFAAAVRLNPQFPEARFRLGFELARQGKEIDAMAQFAEAIRLKPDYAEAHLNMGVALAKQQRYDEAIAHFETALRIDPNYATANKYLEAARIRRKQP